MTAVAIDIRGVNLSYGATHVLKDIDLSIRPGELFAFLGPSGCGKTTLLRLIAGFAQAKTGQVLLDGQDVAALPPWKRDVGMVFQSYALWPHMTVAQNVAFGLEERRKPRAEVAAKVAQALELVGLSAYAQRRPAQLSGGQQQRVALARTIAIEPKVLLLDEPLSNLDAKMRVSVRRDLRELQQRLGLTTIFVTHDQEEANTICDRIAVMEAGVIRQVGTPMELYERPDNLFVAGFLGSANILEAETGRRLVFRPQHATLAPVAGATMSGPVTNREFLGATVRYAIKIGASEILVDVPFQSGAELRGIGETVGVALPAERMLYLPA
jgi:iron(III) transport system ATP-binding protein